MSWYPQFKKYINHTNVLNRSIKTLQNTGSIDDEQCYMPYQICEAHLPFTQHRAQETKIGGEGMDFITTTKVY